MSSDINVEAPPLATAIAEVVFPPLTPIDLPAPEVPAVPLEKLVPPWTTAKEYTGTANDSGYLLSPKKVRSLSFTEVERMSYMAGNEGVQSLFRPPKHIPDVFKDRGVLTTAKRCSGEEIKSCLEAGVGIPISQTDLKNHIPEILAKELREKDQLLKDMATEYDKIVREYEKLFADYKAHKKELEQMFDLILPDSHKAVERPPIGEASFRTTYPTGFKAQEEIWQTKDFFF